MNRDDGTRKGLPLLGILSLLFLGTAGVIFAIIGYVTQQWELVGTGLVLAIVCGIGMIGIFRRSSPNRR